MEDFMLVIVALFPIFFWLAVFIFIIYFIVRSVKKSFHTENKALHQELVKLTRLQEESTEELKAVKDRLAEIEKKSGK